MAHQEAVPGLNLFEWLQVGVGAIEVLEDRPIAAVDHVEEQGTVPLFQIRRAEQGKVRREPDPAIGVLRRKLDVCDRRVDVGEGIDGEVSRPLQQFVRADVAE